MLRGHIDFASRHRIEGWVLDTEDPQTPLSLLITVNDELAARVLANGYRADLEKSGIGGGRHGFAAALKPNLAPSGPCVISVLRETTGEHCPLSPIAVQGPVRFDQAVQDEFAAVLGAYETEAELRARLDFLARQTDRLLQLDADRRSRRTERAARRQFRWRWSPGLQSAAADLPSPPPITLPLRALVIDDTLPAVARDAGSNAVLSHMRALQRLGYEITFAPADMAAGDETPLEALGIACCHAPWHASVEEVMRRETGGFDLVYLHRISTASRYLAMARHYMPRARLVYSVADLHHLRLARQAEAEQRPELLALSRRVQNAELAAAWSADAVITHSSAEAELLRRYVPASRVHVVPWSVPPRPTTMPFAERRGLAFIGGYSHTPNVDAALWLVDEIMPLVLQRDPAIECLLVGSNMPTELRRPRPGVVAIGQVADLAEVFDRVRLTAAPLAYGAGAKGKVLDSLAGGVPCVCTPVAAEGLDLPPELAALVAAEPPGLARLIARLHDDAALNGRCRDAGLAYVAEKLSEQRLDTLMREVAALPAGQ